jgi:hypothetical protein
MNTSKLSFIIVLSLSVFFETFGQTENFVSETKLWSTINNYGQPYSFFTRFSGDTTINQVNYRKVWRSEDEGMVSWVKIGYIREDSDQRVYFMNTQSIEGLLYNFGVSFGDTIYIHNTWHFPDTTFMAVVLDDNLTMFGGQSRRILDIMTAGPPYYHEIWIDGVGSMLGILESGYSISAYVGWGYELLCYSENDSLIYNNPDYNECYYNDIAEYGPTDASACVSPNPVFSESRITLTNMNEKDMIIEICNSLGSLILRQNFKQNDYIIRKSDFPCGIYNFKIMNNSRIISGGKFCIM